MRCHKFQRDAKIRHECDRSRQIFSRATLRVQPTSQRKKIFARNAFSGVSKRWMRRKTRESVQLIRGNGTFCWPRAAGARQISVPFRLAKCALRGRVRAGGSDTPHRSDADLLRE
jgi:hypothetical protein